MGTLWNRRGEMPRSFHQSCNQEARHDQINNAREPPYRFAQSAFGEVRGDGPGCKDDKLGERSFSTFVKPSLIFIVGLTAIIIICCES